VNQAVAAGALHAGQLHIKGLVKEYRAGTPVLRGIDLRIEGTGLTAIIGPSGTGKSTIIRCINRLVDPTAGEIWLDVAGERIDMARQRGAGLRKPAPHRHGVPGIQPGRAPDGDGKPAHGPAGLCLGLGRVAAQVRAAGLRARLCAAQDRGLEEFANQRADALSGGQRQRVGIARALMQQPALLLADEPTSSLDPKTSVEIMQLLRDQGLQHGIPVVVNMHDVELARRFADRIVGMTGGQVVFDGPPAELTDAVLQQIYGGSGWMA
jgi:phosphonate transport system ATP-binding protein